MALRPILRRVRRNSLVAWAAWRMALPLHAAASFLSTQLAMKVKRNGGTVIYDGISLNFPTDVGIDFISGIHWHGAQGFEPNTWQVMRALLPQCGTFLDVGAHIGFYAVLAKKVNPAIEVVAFEPVPAAYAEAEQFFRANGLSPECLSQNAVSDGDGSVTLYLPDAEGVSTMGTIDPPHWRGSKPHVEITVQRTSLDALDAARSLVDPVLIKIDVEDHEASVLRGAMKLIATHRPAIICEILSRRHGNRNTIAAIDAMEYQPFAITEGGCFRVRSYDLSQARPFRDFLLLPTEKVAIDRCFIPFPDLVAVMALSPLVRG
jgi:FkbM family methyltransferase